jgi:hypothetical protein
MSTETDTLPSIERFHAERDHDEALAIARQLSIAGPGITPQHVIDLNRFCDCCDDGEGYDVPKERMRALRDAGLVSGGRFGYYSTTDAGELVRDAWWRP